MDRHPAVKALLAALRSSEFWVAAFQAYIEVSHAPVPGEFQSLGWLYIGARVLSKLVKFVFPNPDGGQWMKADPK